MSGLLIGLAVVVGALLALGPVAWLGGPWLSSRGTLLLCGIGAALDLAALLGGAAPEPIEIPIGLPGSGILFALDGLSALFLLLLFVAGAAAAAAAMGEADERPGAPFLPVLIGAAAATVLAADGFSVVLAWQAAALTLAALAIGGDRRGRAAARVLGGGVASGLLLIAAMALLAPVQSWGLDLSFAGMRAHPPEGFRATAMFLLVLLGGGWAAGLAPLHGWLAPARAAMPAPAGAFLAGGSVGAYLLARVLLDLAGPAPPAWWGAVLLLCGAAGAVLGAARAVRAESIRIIPGAAAVARTGLVCVGLGLALAARAVDLAPLAALALGGAFLAIVTQALAGTLLALAAGAAEAGGGSRHLDRLGGLLRPMPVTAGCAMVAAASLAALPASLGFAAAWTLLQALIGIARVGGLGWQALSAVATLAVASAMVLGAVAAVRLLGIAFLGRPRTPRAAAAREAPLPARVSMLALAVPTVAAGVFPGAVLRLAAPASRLLLGADMSDRAGLLAIAPVPEAPGLAAAALAALLALTTLVTLRLLRLRAAVGHRTGAVWEGGAPPPPPWLPFGDPATQVGAAGFADPLGAMLDAAMPRRPAMARRMLRHWRSLAGWVEAAEGPSAQAGLAALFVALALLLLALALAAPA